MVAEGSDDVAVGAFNDADDLGGGASINLFQDNMFAVRFEIEVAFAVKSADEFILLTGDTATTTTTGA